MKQFFSQIGQEIYVPQNLSIKSGSIYFWGNDNLYPYKLLEAYYNSPTHKSLIDSKVNGIIGEGVIVENQSNLDTYLSFGNQDLNTLAKNIAKDLVLYNSFAMKVVSSLDNKYKHIKSLDYTGVRYSTNIDDEGDSTSIIYSRDWRNCYLKENRKKEYFNYNPNSEEPLQVFIYSEEIKGGEKYTRPSYEAAMESIICEHEIQLFTLRNIKNNYTPAMLIKLKKEMSPEDFSLFKNNLKENYQGSENAGGVLILAGESPETTPDVEFITPTTQDNVYIEQMSNIRTNILTSHQVTNPAIGGLSTGSQFSNGDEIRVAYDLFDRTVISNLRNIIENSLNTVFKDSGWNIGKISIVPTNYDLNTKNNDNTQTQTVSQ